LSPDIYTTFAFNFFLRTFFSGTTTTKRIMRLCIFAEIILRTFPSPKYVYVTFPCRRMPEIVPYKLVDSRFWIGRFTIRPEFSGDFIETTIFYRGILHKKYTRQQSFIIHTAETIYLVLINTFVLWSFN